MKVYKKSKVYGRMGVFFALLGLALVIFGAVIAVREYQDRASFDSVMAMIVDIQAEPGDGRRVYVSYNVDGENYFGRLSYYTSSMRIGQEIEIYVDSSNPEKIRSGGILVFCAIFGGIGLAFFVIGVLMILYCISKEKQCRRLIDGGYFVSAEYLRTEYSGVSINHRIYYTIACVYNDGENEHIFKSDTLFSVSDFSVTLAGRCLTVYVDRDDFKKYHVDTRDIEREL